MHEHITSSARRRTALAAVGAVALSLAACGPTDPDDEASSSPDYEPVKTTSTTEPPPSSSSTPSGEPRPDPPDGADLLTRAKERMSVMSTVTIDGTLAMQRDGKSSIPMKLHSAGSMGGGSSQGKHAGASTTTLTTDNGGKLELHAQGWFHYFRANDAWFERLGTDETRLAKYSGRWLKIPYDNSPFENLNPNQLVNGTFFGESLKQVQVASTSGSTDQLDGEWVGRLQIPGAGDDEGVLRTMWVSLDPEAPEVLKVTYGKNKNRATYRFSKWDETNDDLTPPKGAKSINEDLVKGIVPQEAG